MKRRVLQSRAIIDFFFWLKHNLGCQSFCGTCSFHVSDTSHTNDGQRCDLNKEINKIIQETFGHHSFNGFPLYLVLVSIRIILSCLPILIRLAMQVVHSTMTSITANIFALKMKYRKNKGHRSLCAHR